MTGSLPPVRRFSFTAVLGGGPGASDSDRRKAAAPIACYRDAGLRYRQVLTFIPGQPAWPEFRLLDEGQPSSAGQAVVAAAEESTPHHGAFRMIPP